MMPSNYLILCHSLLLLFSIFSIIRVFPNESALCIRWPKYWSFSFSISLFNEYSGLISFRIDWLDLLAVQGTLKSLLQHHYSKTSILQSAFFMVQFSHLYMTTGKTGWMAPLTQRTWVWVSSRSWWWTGKPGMLAPQFKSISSLVLSFLYCPTLTSTHDYCKNHNFDQMDLC